MKKIILILIISLSNSIYAIDWKAKGEELIGDVVSNPASFFYDFQQDLEATLPLPPAKDWGIQTGLFPTILPMGYLNLSAKLNLLKENRLSPGVPQLDLISGYQNMILSKLLANQSNDINDAKLNGYYYGFIITSSVSPKTRTFWGYKHSQLNTKLSFASGKEPEILGVTINSFDTGFKDDFLIIGLQTLKEVDKYWSIQLNYGFSQNNITTKVSWYSKWFELGLNIYPEGVLVIHPIWNFHLNF